MFCCSYDYKALLLLLWLSLLLLLVFSCYSISIVLLLVTNDCFRISNMAGSSFFIVMNLALRVRVNGSSDHIASCAGSGEEASKVAVARSELAKPSRPSTGSGD